MTFVKCPNCKEEFEVDEKKYDLTYVGCPNCYAFFFIRKEATL
jgi:DNA-directed RNA polymerase subunit RPC12/RpoP